MTAIKLPSSCRAVKAVIKQNVCLLKSFVEKDFDFSLRFVL
jgi:hypothetical protein